MIAELDTHNVIAVVLSSLVLPRTQEWAARAHPKLRVNLMHAGLPFLEGTLAIMRRYPQVYADLSKISDANAYPREQFHDYLRSLVRANLGDRLMFGSDAAGPGALGPSIEGITSAAFLDDRQKRAILCENAARFFRLTTRPGVNR